MKKLRRLIKQFLFLFGENKKHGFLTPMTVEAKEHMEKLDIRIWDLPWHGRVKNALVRKEFVLLGDLYTYWKNCGFHPRAFESIRNIGKKSNSVIIEELRKIKNV